MQKFISFNHVSSIAPISSVGTPRTSSLSGYARCYKFSCSFLCLFIFSLSCVGIISVRLFLGLSRGFDGLIHAVSQHHYAVSHVNP